MADYHQPVLLQESIAALDIHPDGIYVDATYGGGGHAREILKQLRQGKLYAFDQDPDAGQNVIQDERLVFVQQNFRHIKRFLKLYKTIPVNGIIADLGVSSHQLDTPARGFSLRFNATLDMRMDPAIAFTAKEVLNAYEEKKLLQVLSGYGEIRNAKSLVAAIASARKKQRIETIEQLKSIIQPLIKGNRNKYLAQLFQALRIEVNQELEALKELLSQSAEVLKQGGRLVIIAYHSLEDRLAKNYIKAGNFEGEVEKDIYGNQQRIFRQLNKKPLMPSAREVADNPRARSARMRAAEKI